MLAAVYISQRRWRRWGGDPDDIVTVAIWAVPAGLIGARLYHVATDWNRLYSEGRWADAFKIWQGGLGIPGGEGGAVAAALRRGADLGHPHMGVPQALGVHGEGCHGVNARAGGRWGQA